MLLMMCLMNYLMKILSNLVENKRMNLCKMSKIFKIFIKIKRKNLKNSLRISLYKLETLLKKEKDKNSNKVC